MLLISPNILPKNQQQYKSKIAFRGKFDRQIAPKAQPKILQTSKKPLNILKNIIKIPLLIVGGLIMTPIFIYKLLKETDKEDKRIKKRVIWYGVNKEQINENKDKILPETVYWVRGKIWSKW